MYTYIILLYCILDVIIIIIIIIITITITITIIIIIIIINIIIIIIIIKKCIFLIPPARCGTSSTAPRLLGSTLLGIRLFHLQRLWPPLLGA